MLNVVRAGNTTPCDFLKSESPQWNTNDFAYFVYTQSMRSTPDARDVPDARRARTQHEHAHSKK
jgi:hypothetical protein